MKKQIGDLLKEAHKANNLKKSPNLQFAKRHKLTPTEVNDSLTSSSKVSNKNITELHKNKDFNKHITNSHSNRFANIDENLEHNIRINVALANAGVGSRRFCDELLKNNKVTINGKSAVIGQMINYRDQIVVDNKIIRFKTPKEIPRVVVYHKLEGELVSHNDPQKRKTVFDRLPYLRNARFIAIGRLDINSSGLLLFTTSGDLANRFMHPKFEMIREYAVRIYSGALTVADIAAIKNGIKAPVQTSIHDANSNFKKSSSQIYELLKADLKPIQSSMTGKNQWYKVTLTEGKKNEVRRIFAFFGLTVSRLIRTRFGPVTLPPQLKRGHYHELHRNDVITMIRNLEQSPE